MNCVKYEVLVVEGDSTIFMGIKCSKGDIIWTLDGKIHREGGPAIECANGDKFYFINGFRHREDGPAAEYVDGTKEYYLFSKSCKDQEEFEKTLKKITEGKLIDEIVNLPPIPQGTKFEAIINIIATVDLKPFKEI